MHTINSIKTTLQENKATILKADKGNTILIWYIDEQISKTHEFIRNNHFSFIPNDPNNTFHKEIRKIFNFWNHTIRKEDKWKYVALNPTAPTLKGLLKIHTNGTPIRPIVNWHKLAQLLSKLIEVHVPQPYAFNVKNSIHLIEDLESTPISNSRNFASHGLAICIPIYLPKKLYTRWFKYDRDWSRQIYTQTVPVIFEPPSIS